jgi:hypothetical protein
LDKGDNAVKKRRSLMEKKSVFILISLVCLLFVSSGRVIAQEENVSSPISEVESDILWLWGEVDSIDTQNKALVVKYFDYETDQEKEMTVTTDNKTIFENIKSFEEIKPQDTVSVDYIVASDGKNIAKNISLEKPEAMLEPQTPLPQQTDASLATPSQQPDASQVQPMPAAQDNQSSNELQAAPTASEKTN